MSLAAAIVFSFACSSAWAGGPSSSLWHRDAPIESKSGTVPQGDATSTAPTNAAFFYQASKPPRKELRLHEIITITVSENSAMDSKGNTDDKKTNTFDHLLKSWIKLDGSSILPVKPSVAPELSGSSTSQFKGDAQLKTQDSLTFMISATVVDIRPNGNLVLEAHKYIRINEEVWEHSLTGIVRKEDVLPNNTVRSERVAELSINKRTLGSIRDGTRRGWWTRFWDNVTPF